MSNNQIYIKGYTTGDLTTTYSLLIHRLHGTGSNSSSCIYSLSFRRWFLFYLIFCSILLRSLVQPLMNEFYYGVSFLSNSV